MWNILFSSSQKNPSHKGLTQHESVNFVCELFCWWKSSCRTSKAKISWAKL